MSIFKEYADITQEIKILEERKKELNEKCLAEMKENKEKTTKTDFGTFTLVERKSYKYSDEFRSMKADWEKKIQDDLKEAEVKIILKYEDVQEKVLLKQKEEEVPENLVVAESLRFQAK